MTATGQTLDDSKPPASSRRPLITGFALLLGMCFWGGVIFSAATFIQMGHRPFTPQFKQYLINQDIQRRGQPSYVAPPYVGPRRVTVSIWDYGTTYGAATAVAIGATAVGVRIWRRLRRVGKGKGDIPD